MTSHDPSASPGSAGGVPAPGGHQPGKSQHDGTAADRGILETLCRIYWIPIQDFIRQSCTGTDEARALTGDYCRQLLGRDDPGEALRAHANFRVFLLGDLSVYLANLGGTAQSPEGEDGVKFAPIQADLSSGDNRPEPSGHASRDRLFNRQWALIVLERVMDSLQTQYRQKGRLAQFNALKPFISWNAGAASYLDAASKLGCDETSVRQGIYRLRQRYRKLLVAEVSRTVAPPDAVAAEIRHLAASLGAGNP